MKTFSYLSFLAFIITGSLLTGLRAAEKDDFLVNDDGTRTSQDRPRIAVALDHTFVITWVDRRNSSSDIYQQAFDTSGNPISQNQKLNDDVNEASQYEPSLATAADGGFRIVWKDYRQYGYPVNPDLYSQLLDAASIKQGANQKLTLEWPDSACSNPDIALSESGWGVVVWADYRNRHWDIYAQRLNPDGSLQGNNFKVNDEIGSFQQHSPRVDISPQGWYVVTWYDNRFGDDDIFVQVFDSLGNRKGTNQKVSEELSGARQAFPDVAADGRGHFTVVWVDWRNGVYPANPDIYSRKLDTTLTSVTGEININQDGRNTAQKEPSIDADRMGNVCIIWADSNDGSWNIVGQMIDVDGVVRENNFQANSFADSIQINPDVALDGRNRYLAWADKRNGHFDIFSAIQKYNDPSLVATPASLTFTWEIGFPYPDAQQVELDHFGYNPLPFIVQEEGAWLTVSPPSGTTPRTLLATVDVTGLTEGTYYASALLIDNLNHDSSVVLPVALNIFSSQSEPSLDTIRVDPIVVETGTQASTSITAYVLSQAKQFHLPLSFDNSRITVDSVLKSPTLPPTTAFSVNVDNQGGRLSLDWIIDSTEQLPIGAEHYLGEIFFTAANTVGTTYIDTATSDTSTLRLTAFGGQNLLPTFLRGEVTVTVYTSIDNDAREILPRSLKLHQNTPNPFNSTTLITFELPRQAEVTLEIFNILGQRIKTLNSGTMSAGSYSLTWDGTLENGHSAPTGVYFYRLQSIPITLIKKMLLVK